MDVFNPKILDASIRDVATCLSDNQKVDLLLYAIKNMQYEGRSRTVIENAIQSCLQIATLSPENTARARILRARARLSVGSLHGAHEDLQAALLAEPDNPEAKAMLHQRSVTVEKLLAPLPPTRGRFSIEIWREIALFLPRRDLKALLFVPHAVSRVASQLLFRELDLHFCGPLEYEEEIDAWVPHGSPTSTKENDTRHAQRTADILTRIITDPVFANAVRTLRIYAPRRDKDGSLAFQTGMLTNALPKLINLKNVHISACSEGIGPVLRVLQQSSTRLRGLSIHSPDGSADLGCLDLRHLAHFAYVTSAGSPTPTVSFLLQNRPTLRTLTLDNPTWSFPTEAISIRNLTHINFTGHFPLNSQAPAEIFAHGRQLESLSFCCAIECMASSQFRSLLSPPPPALHAHGHGHGHAHARAPYPSQILPFLRHFSFTVHTLGRRTVDRDLFPALAEFLRGRKQLRTLSLISYDESIQRAVGFDASVWGVLPSLENLRGLTMTYPKDLAPGLAAWLVPREVRALTLDCASLGGRDMIPFLTQLKAGIPSSLRYIGLLECPIRSVSTIVDTGFPQARVVRIGCNYFTIKRKASGSGGGLSHHLLSSGVGMVSGGGHGNNHSHSHNHGGGNASGGGGSGGGSGVPGVTISGSGAGGVIVGGHGHPANYEIEQWPRRRVLYHLAEWLEWLGCEDALPGAPPDFPIY